MPNEHAPIHLAHRAESHLATGEAPACRRHASILSIVVRRLLGRVMRLLSNETIELSTMSDRELRDFGISRHEAEYAEKRAFWMASLERW